jgi:hypothetical protein
MAAHTRPDRDVLERLAAGRQRADGRPVFGLTAEEIKRSTKTAMRLTGASKSHVIDPQPETP